MVDVAAMTARFRAQFGGRPALYRAPGRVNLIGEHTDYNEGWVMPAALHFETTVALARTTAPRLRIRSEVLDETVDVPLNDDEALRRARAHGHWSDYVIGVVLALRRRNVTISGADVVVASDIPLGAGLSSSASFEVCIAYALTDVMRQPLDRLALAAACQEAENDYVGMRCGIMDQFAATLGVRDHALALDCRTLDFRPVSLAQAGAPPMSIVVCNTLVRHAHAGGEYNQRRLECERAVTELGRYLPGLRSLRDVTLADLDTYSAQMEPVARRRAQHIVSENLRVTGAIAALQTGDFLQFGRLMGESHRSLRDDFSVSCRELDVMVSIAEGLDGVFGARMTGGGFGGCTVNWVRSDAVEHFTQTVGNRYTEAMGCAPEIYLCTVADGVSRISE